MLNTSLQIMTDLSRYTAHPNGYHAAVQLSEDYATRARSELDIDDPSIDCLQALLLLAVAFTAAGKGKKAYMMICAYKSCNYENSLIHISKRNWHGDGSGAASRIRPKSQSGAGRKRNAKAAVLDMLSDG